MYNLLIFIIVIYIFCLSIVYGPFTNMIKCGEELHVVHEPQIEDRCFDTVRLDLCLIKFGLNLLCLEEWVNSIQTKK